MTTFITVSVYTCLSAQVRVHSCVHMQINASRQEANIE